MPKRILWIDNDKVFLASHFLRLKVEGYVVDQMVTLTEGLEALQSNNYDLLILDVMMPVRIEEDGLFSEKDTNSGKKSGLVFYNKYKEMLKKKGIVVFVFTIREDKVIRNEFLAAGLSAENYMTKPDGADTATFFAKVKQLLGE